MTGVAYALEMGAKLGENIEREWSEDSSPGELWDSLQLIKQDRRAGIKALADLSDRGSTLAMMYLGFALTNGGDPDEVGQGEVLLSKAAKGGSIEGGFQLAQFLITQERGADAVSQLKALAELQYGPAMYRLGSILYRGELVDRDLPQAVAYLERAKAAGHLPSMALLSWIYRKHGFGMRGRLAAHWNCLAKVPSLLWCLIRYPSSDRLRGFALPLARDQL